MKNKFLFIALLISIFNFSQVKTNYSLIDSKIAKIPSNLCNSTTNIANYINSNFKTENDKIRAIFYWTTSNISYDVKNMFTDNSKESPQEKIENTLKTKKGVCINYAEIFNDLCIKTGIQCQIIQGYTKQNGRIATLSHAWCGAKINQKWTLFDPTWGAGYVNNGLFVKKINEFYFSTDPSKFIESHMPYDYLWQFLNYPITNQEFYDSKFQINKTKPHFDFATEIDKNLSLTENDRIWESRKRIEKNGVKNKLIQEYLSYKKSEQEVLNHNTSVEKLNEIGLEYNQAIVLLNEYINYRNRKFKPALADDEISRMIETPKNSLQKCQETIDALGPVGKENLSLLSSLRKSIYDALSSAKEQELFVKKYLSKSKTGRKSMFSSLTWFGIPLN